MMKKIVSFLLIFSMLFTFISCEQTEENENPVTSTTTEREVFTEEKNDIAYYPSPDPFSETPTRLLYVNSGVIYYYNKLTAENYIFCFDPLCKHNDYSCISWKFEMASYGWQTIRYSAYDNRFYALRGQQFCSFAFDGSDLKVLHSFGEEGSFDNEQMPYAHGDLVYLQIGGKYVYFLASDSESGKRGLMRYDAETQKMERLFYDADTSIYGYLLDGDTLYMSMVGTYAGLYRMNTDGTEITLISSDVYEAFANGIFDGEFLYLIQNEAIYDEEKDRIRNIPKKLVVLSLETGEFTDVFDVAVRDDHRLLAVTEDYIYYTVKEPRSIGYYTAMGHPQEETNDYSKIYRFNKKNGEVAVVLDDLCCETRMLYFIEEKVFILGTVCIVSETMAWKNSGGFTASMDENGMFIDLTLMED